MYQHSTKESPTHQTNGTTHDTSYLPGLALTSAGRPRASINNLCLILDQLWPGRLWHDIVRNQPMHEESPLNDDDVMAACRWLADTYDIHLASTALMEKCLITTCHQHPKDLLQEWLKALPAWDGDARLDHWLRVIAHAPDDAYGRAVSRIIPLSMVARALNPGCLYRFVVILEGPEGSGKTSLVRALAGEEWYTELTKGLDNKEIYMLIQGAWVAEMAELDTLTRSEESRLKAFVTAKEDQYIPKYSNLKISVPRRTILLGTTNDKSYLKGQTGNTRFLPITTGARIHVESFDTLRDQLFAEALDVYTKNPAGWWQLPAEATKQAVDERDARRVHNVYEQALGIWLDDEGVPTATQDASSLQRITDKNETTWEEIAQKFLHLDPAAWKDKNLQMQIADALKGGGWEHHRDRQSTARKGQVWRYWRRGGVTTCDDL